MHMAAIWKCGANNWISNSYSSFKFANWEPMFSRFTICPSINWCGWTWVHCSQHGRVSFNTSYCISISRADCDFARNTNWWNFTNNGGGFVVV